MNSIMRGGLSFLLFVLPGLVWAQGGPPMLTDDPDTPGDGKWEVNVAYIEKRTHAERLRGFPHIDLNYGLGERTQLKYETEWLFRRTEADRSQSGVGNSLLGVKHRFWDEDADGVNVSVYPQVELENAPSSVARGITSAGPNYFLPLEASRMLGPLHVVIEIGYALGHSEPNAWKFGMLVAQEVTQTIEATVELHRTQPVPLGAGETIVNAGIRSHVSEHTKLLASLGTGLSSSPDRPRLMIYVGLQIGLGSNH